MAAEIESAVATMSDDGVGVVSTRSIELFAPPHPLVLDSGEQFGPITVAYETYGELSPQRDNAVFVAMLSPAMRTSPGSTVPTTASSAGGIR